MTGFETAWAGNWIKALEASKTIPTPFSSKVNLPKTYYKVFINEGMTINGFM